MAHFSKGSDKPALKGESLRLYSMRFCPFAQRARLVLAAKGIEYECVNVNLMDKPEWFIEMNPAGAVPVIELPDGKVLYESAICCEFLEDFYPEKEHLFPKDLVEKHKQRIMVEVLGSKLIPAYYKEMLGDGSPETVAELNKHLTAFEKELNGKKFVGGSSPSMADYLMWPWIERLYLITDLLKGFPVLSAWCAAMSEVPAVKECTVPAEWHKKFYEGYKAKNPDAQLVAIVLWTKMTHFSKGSEKPVSKTDGLRLYSMRFCPYAQRTRLVLAAKGIEHECVNINLKDKPEWFFELNPVGKVPVIELPGGKVIYESAICCDFLEDMYPGKTNLFPKDPFEKHKQRLLVEVLCNKLTSAFYKSIRGGDDAKEELYKQLAALEKELKERNTKFIGGSSPSMADYLIWPWLERLYLLTDHFKTDLGKFPVLSAWCAAMSDVPAVKECSYPAEWHKKFLEGYSTGNAESQLYGIEEKV
ncbi:unnamed protein product [Pocillopora meandrina]|uniref:Uncharacterized protein n=1 Tax=Pocillopora meandrina TaxID=46732 RepID=A0AAU9WQ10_9CNID|nr:unnamed protein product [Pocillopora meandrina]